MSNYRISEAARATGFTVSALRFYEQEGVVVPDRTETGYRSYGDEDIEALRFVARGRELGLSLDQIDELLALLDDEECEPVQSRIHELITERVAQAQDRIGELVEFTAQLQEFKAKLGVRTPEGACDETCGCRAEPAPPDSERETELIPLAGADAPDIACSLRPEQVGNRIEDWREVLSRSDARAQLENGVRVGFADVDVAALARLAEAEQACCSFFQFNIGVGPRGITLDVTGPEESQDVITSVFGTAAPREESLT